MKSLAKQSGMTLLEVLVATSILAVISAMAFLTIDNMVRAKTSLKEHTDALNQQNRALFVLQNDLQMAVSSQQLGVPNAEFIADSRSISLLRYKNELAISSKIQGTQVQDQTVMRRVKWYVRDKHLIRAVQPAHQNIQFDSKQEQVLIDVKGFICDYIGDSGDTVNRWPNSLRENSQVPRVIRCTLVTQNDQTSVIKVTPWQAIW